MNPIRTTDAMPFGFIGLIATGGLCNDRVALYDMTNYIILYCTERPSHDTPHHVCIAGAHITWRAPSQ